MVVDLPAPFGPEEPEDLALSDGESRSASAGRAEARWPGRWIGRPRGRSASSGGRGQGGHRPEATRAVRHPARRLGRCPHRPARRCTDAQDHSRRTRARAGQLPFSKVVEANGFVFLAGQVGDAPGWNGPVPGGIEAETRAMLDNVGRLLRAVGLDYARRRQVHGLPARLRRVRGDERGVSRVLPDRAADASDGRRHAPWPSASGSRSRSSPPADRRHGPTGGSPIAPRSGRATPAPDDERGDRHHRVAGRTDDDDAQRDGPAARLPDAS